MTALRALGLGNDQLSTINYNVYPEQRYEQGKEPVIVAYNVTNTVLVDVRKLSQVGPVIDAALAHGANIRLALMQKPPHVPRGDPLGRSSELISRATLPLHLAQ